MSVNRRAGVGSPRASAFWDWSSALPRPREAVDFGAGPGIDARFFAERGFTVDAYDVDPRMRDFFADHCRDLIDSGRVTLDGSAYREFLARSLGRRTSAAPIWSYPILRRSIWSTIYASCLRNSARLPVRRQSTCQRPEPLVHRRHAIPFVVARCAASLARRRVVPARSAGAVLPAPASSFPRSERAPFPAESRFSQDCRPRAGLSKGVDLAA